MSAINSVTLDTLVSVKVVYEGNVRRFKLGLKDVGPSMFQDKLRELLVIPENQEVKFERYSDSAGRYITLDPENTSVYKQLFRAAKAKLKLRIKVTTGAVQTDGDLGITSATSLPQPPLPPSYSTIHLNRSSSSTDVSSPSCTVVDSTYLEKAVSKAVTDYCSSSKFTIHLQETVREEVQKKHESTHPSSMAELEPPKLESPMNSSMLSNFVTPGLIKAAQHTNNSCSVIVCDSCNVYIQGIHYHCNICNGGDFDLCHGCGSREKHCKDLGHSLFKRSITGAKITDLHATKLSSASRLCNCCVDGFEDEECVVCKDCEDYDLCLQCLRAGKHGHDPRHEFAPAHKSMKLKPEEKKLLHKGRDVEHAAFCDGCDETIIGVRYKCTDCPDWDYCDGCIQSSHQTHPGHRFVSVLDSLSLWPHNSYNIFANVSHFGVYCDGPICRQSSAESYIEGVRYKCAICPDTDFCSTCEASPLNEHNHTHPLIKLKIPIRNVLVTTTDGTNIVMGDREASSEPRNKSAIPSSTANTATQVQTFVNVKPSEDDASFQEPKSEWSKEQSILPKADETPTLCATFERDAISDGTVLSTGQCFTQTWFMKNTGKTAWPVGVTVNFVGGTCMFIKSNDKPLNVTVTDSEIQPGETVGFSVDLSATCSPNKNYTSYWRLTGPNGARFGDNMWCSINVIACEPNNRAESMDNEQSHKQENSHNEENVEEEEHQSQPSSSVCVVDEESSKDREEIENAAELLVKSQSSSEMVFPKLSVESPVDSLEHHPSSDFSTLGGISIPVSPSGSSHKTFALSEDGDVEEVVEISSLDGFLTDEEYDVLDASDEEFERVAY